MILEVNHCRWFGSSIYKRIKENGKGARLQTQKTLQLSIATTSIQKTSSTSFASYVQHGSINSATPQQTIAELDVKLMK